MPRGSASIHKPNLLTLVIVDNLVLVAIVKLTLAQQVCDGDVGNYRGNGQQPDACMHQRGWAVSTTAPARLNQQGTGYTLPTVDIGKMEWQIEIAWLACERHCSGGVFKNILWKLDSISYSDQQPPFQPAEELSLRRT